MSTKLQIRDWQASDMEQIASLHAKMQPGYSLPQEFGPLFPIRKAVVEENGQIVAAATVKLVSEAFLWVNDKFSGLRRAHALKMLSESCSAEAKRLGLEEVSCWVPPKIAQCFARILVKLGWRKSPWPNFTIVLESRPK